jgi:cytoskeletal protein RodZ
MKRTKADNIVREKINRLEAGVDADLSAAWQKLELRMDNAKPALAEQPVRRSLMPWLRWSVAALLLLMVGATVFLLRNPASQQAQLADKTVKEIPIVMPSSYPGQKEELKTKRENTVAIVPAHKEKAIAISPVPAAPAVAATTGDPGILHNPEPAEEVSLTAATKPAPQEPKAKVQQVLKREMEVAYIDDILDLRPQPATAPAKSSFVKIGGYQQPGTKTENENKEDSDPNPMARGKAAPASHHAITIKF